MSLSEDSDLYLKTDIMFLTFLKTWGYQDVAACYIKDNKTDNKREKVLKIILPKLITYLTRAL